MSTLTVPPTNGFKPPMPNLNGLQSSVQAFFSAINWEDNPPEVQRLRQEAIPQAGSASTVKELTLSMSVSSFFAAFNWDNATIAAAVSAPVEAARPKPKDLTLDDFSDLF